MDMKKILFLLLMVPLAGCSVFQDRPNVGVSYPDSLFKCMDKPDPNTVQTDNDLGILITKQDAVIDDCKSRLSNVGELIRANQPKTDKQKK